MCICRDSKLNCNLSTDICFKRNVCCMSLGALTFTFKKNVDNFEEKDSVKVLILTVTPLTPICIQPNSNYVETCILCYLKSMIPPTVFNILTWPSSLLPTAHLALSTTSSLYPTTSVLNSSATYATPPQQGSALSTSPFSIFAAIQTSPSRMWEERSIVSI